MQLSLPVTNVEIRKTLQRSAANQRERKRMHSINRAFKGLRAHVPEDWLNSALGGASNVDKVSKVDTLRAAIDYIQALHDLLNGYSRPPTPICHRPLVCRFHRRKRNCDKNSHEKPQKCPNNNNEESAYITMTAYSRRLMRPVLVSVSWQLPENRVRRPKLGKCMFAVCNAIAKAAQESQMRNGQREKNCPICQQEVKQNLEGRAKRYWRSCKQRKMASRRIWWPEMRLMDTESQNHGPSSAGCHSFMSNSSSSLFDEL
ncbi:hypothetical protein Ciccas_007284 [Cichlidogyrus casuarinus]|uniref:BHLH domain-containing protein n=1 Tax=Cichlidogyrus casuarinus TaxID=1844966 RepID=A0ABD2Q3D4_9PLAT